VVTTETVCPVVIPGEELPCGRNLFPHCPAGTGPQCDWQKCVNGHIIRPDGHVMGEDTP
jgi:hypothetical protein